LRELPLQVAGPLGLRPRRLASLDLSQLRVPDTSAAKAAEELCQEMRPEMLINHSYRTYAWAAAVAAHKRIAYDNEVVYVSSLLHDLGIAHSHRQSGGGCFTLIGADAAARTAKGAGWADNRAELAADAITLHMNLRVAKDSPEAWLTAFGTQLDAVGAGFWTVDRATREAVIERYPRADVKQTMAGLFDWQARHNPGTRAQFYARYLSLRWRLRHTPFES
jgi:hypothetical protein